MTNEIYWVNSIKPHSAILTLFATVPLAFVLVK